MTQVEEAAGWLRMAAFVQAPGAARIYDNEVACDDEPGGLRRCRLRAGFQTDVAVCIQAVYDSSAEESNCLLYSAIAMFSASATSLMHEQAVVARLWCCFGSGRCMRVQVAVSAPLILELSCEVLPDPLTPRPGAEGVAASVRGATEMR